MKTDKEVIDDGFEQVLERLGVEYYKAHSELVSRAFVKSTEAGFQWLVTFLPGVTKCRYFNLKM